MTPSAKQSVHRTGKYVRILVSLLIVLLLGVPPAAAATCGGLADTDPLVCSGHGTCPADDTCACAEGWAGASCSVATFCGGCPNMCNTTSASVCVPHGSSATMDLTGCLIYKHGWGFLWDPTCDTYGVIAGTNGGETSSCYCANGYAGICCNVYIADRYNGDLFTDETGMLVPSSVDFGNVTVGSGPAAPVTVSFVNDGAIDTETITGITTSGADAGDFMADTSSCWPGMALSPKGTCTIRVSFTPSAAGSRTATLVVTTGSGRVREMSLAGTGTRRVSSIVTDPAAKTRVFAGIDGAGIFRSTDSGGSWSAAALTPLTTRVKALVVKPGDGSTLFAGTYGSGVYKSTDSGATWNACMNTGLANRNVLALTGSSTGRLYAGTEDGVYTSTDCDTWTALNNGLP